MIATVKKGKGAKGSTSIKSSYVGERPGNYQFYHPSPVGRRRLKTSVDLMFFNAFDDDTLFCVVWFCFALSSVYQTIMTYNQRRRDFKCSKNRFLCSFLLCTEFVKEIQRSICSQIM